MLRPRRMAKKSTCLNLPCKKYKRCILRSKSSRTHAIWNRACLDMGSYRRQQQPPGASYVEPRGLDVVPNPLFFDLTTRKIHVRIEQYSNGSRVHELRFFTRSSIIFKIQLRWRLIYNEIYSVHTICWRYLGKVINAFKFNCLWFENLSNKDSFSTFRRISFFSPVLPFP